MNNREIDSVLDQVLDIVRWHRQLPPDYTGLNDLLYNRRVLSGYSVELATEVGAAWGDYRRAKNEYDKKLYSDALKWLQEYGDSKVSKAEWTAKKNATIKMDPVIITGQYYEQISGVLKQVNQVLSEMNQWIAELRKEKEKNYEL